jgi:predicted helicase
MIDRRISETYAAASKASNKTALSDAYVNFFRWGTDRLNRRDGMLCLVSNNSFIEQVAFDGFRKHVRRDFDDLFHIDLEGNVRANPKLSGTDYNVFGIQLGVGITVAVRSRSKPNAKRPIKFRRVDKTPRRENKLAWLAQQQSIGHGKWQQLLPENDEYWLVPDHADEFKRLVPIAARSAKAGLPGAPNVVLREFSRGVATCRDAYLYDFDNTELARRVKAFIEAYNIEVDRYRRANKE